MHKFQVLYAIFYVLEHVWRPHKLCYETVLLHKGILFLALPVAGIFPLMTNEAEWDPAEPRGKPYLLHNQMTGTVTRTHWF